MESSLVESGQAPATNNGEEGVTDALVDAPVVPSPAYVPPHAYNPDVVQPSAPGQPEIQYTPNPNPPQIQYINAQGQPVVQLSVQQTVDTTTESLLVPANNNNATSTNGDYLHPMGCNKALRIVACICGSIGVVVSISGMCVDQLATATVSNVTIDCGWTEFTATSHTNYQSHTYANYCKDGEGSDEACRMQDGAIDALVFLVISTIFGGIGVLITQPFYIVKRCFCHKYQGNVMFFIAFVTTLTGLIIYVAMDDFCLRNDHTTFKIGLTWVLCISSMTIFLAAAIMAR